MYLLALRFVEAKSDTSLFVFSRDADTVYLLLYVDDIVLTASSTALLQHTIFYLRTASGRWTLPYSVLVRSGRP
jgi:hypothetical protein